MHFDESHNTHFRLLAARVFALAVLAAALVFPCVAQTTADTNIKPGDDFFAYANASWLKTAAIPAGKERWGARDELEDLTRRRIATLLDAAGSAPAGSAARKVADFRTAYLNESAIEAKGLTSLKPLLDRVDKVSDK